MTKAEREEMARLRVELAKARAFRFTLRVDPDIPVPKHGQPIAKGFLFNVYNEKVVPACSSSISHCFGSDEAPTTRGGLRLFGSRLLAFRALRHALEDRFATALAAVDSEIDELEKGIGK